jgi:long-chain fatty acid transport protein
MGTRYSPNWTGRYNSIETKLETFTVSPTIAFKVPYLERLSIGTGFRALYADFFNDKLVRTPMSALEPFWGPTMGRVVVKGDGCGFGWLLGAKYEVLDNLDIGAVYRSRVRVNIEGEARYESRTDSLIVPPPASHSASGDATIILPSSATVGANYYLLERRLNLGAAVTWTEWSTYDALNINFAGAGILGNSRNENEKNWNDVWRFGFGASYSITEHLSAMAGYVYDFCPINENHTDFMMPAGSRHIFGVGLGYARDNWFVNAGYNYLMMIENSRNVANGEQDGQTKWLKATFGSMDAHMFALSVGLNF